MSVTSFDCKPPEAVEQGGAEPVALEPLPFAQETGVQDLAARSQVDVERLEAAIVEAVRRIACGRGREVPAARAGGATQRGGVLGAQAGDVRLHTRAELVAVVHLAEHLLELLGVLRALLGGRAERGCGHLEHVAQALGRDAHVVQLLHSRGIARCGGERAQLVQAHRHDLQGVLGERARRVDALHLARLHAAVLAAVTSTASRSRRPVSWISRSFAASVSLPACCCASSSAARLRIPRASSRVSASAMRWSSAMCTSGSRRSPSASARSFTSRSVRLYSFFGKHGSKISIAARSLRVATRMSWTRSMSSVSRTPSACSKTSVARVSTASAAASRKLTPVESSGISRALAIRPPPRARARRPRATPRHRS